MCIGCVHISLSYSERDHFRKKKNLLREIRESMKTYGDGENDTIGNWWPQRYQGNRRGPSYKEEDKDI